MVEPSAWLDLLGAFNGRGLIAASLIGSLLGAVVVVGSVNHYLGLCMHYAAREEIWTSHARLHYGLTRDSSLIVVLDLGFSLDRVLNSLYAFTRLFSFDYEGRFQFKRLVREHLVGLIGPFVCERLREVGNVRLELKLILVQDRALVEHG